MADLMKDPVMSAQQFAKLAAIIYERSGIHFPENKKYVLESRLGRRLQELEVDDYDQYISFLSVGPYRDDEFQEIFNKITINETSFFRNEPQLDVFEKQFLGRLLESRGTSKRLRLWSAACSTGEEPLTLAMQVHRTLGLRLMDWRVEVLGTDISERALAVAAEGKYADYAVRSTSPLIKQKYFKQDGPYWNVDPAIRQMVHFETLNLKDRLGAKRLGKFDVIFCRNVMIYFDDAMRAQVINMFHDQLADDGALFIGHSESLRGLNVPFEQVNIPQGFVYVKKGHAKEAAPNMTVGGTLPLTPAAGTVPPGSTPRKVA
ncbi:MAG: CheR family methyltransferase [Phycisphaerales bacterium]